MKKKFITILSSLVLLAGVLTSCDETGNSNGDSVTPPVSEVPSSQPSAPEVPSTPEQPSTGKPSTGAPSAGENPSTNVPDQPSAQPSIPDQPSVQPSVPDVPVEHHLSIVSTAESYKVGDGAATLTAQLEAGDKAVLTDVAWDVSELNEIGQVLELPKDHPDKADYRRFFVPAKFGSGKISVTAKADGKEVRAEIALFVDVKEYKDISTAEQFVELISRKGTIQDNYRLTTNIDLGGMIVNGRVNESYFQGVLNGNGYTVKNFVVKNDSNDLDKEPDKATGLFYMFQGTLMNLHLQGTIDSAAFSGIVAKEANTNAVIENCLFEVTHLRNSENDEWADGYDWTWSRNGAIVAVMNGKSKLKNCVTSLNVGKSGAICLPFAAYTWNGEHTFENLYTNIAKDNENPNYQTFYPEQGTIATPSGTVINVKHTPFETTPASAYDTLDASIWNLEDNKMPTLKHFGENALTLDAKLTASVDHKVLSMAGEKVATIQAELKYSEDTPSAYSYTTDPEDVSAIADITNNNDGTFTVTGIAAGEFDITISAEVGESSLTSNTLHITVQEGEIEVKQINFVNTNFYGDQFVTVHWNSDEERALLASAKGREYTVVGYDDSGEGVHNFTTSWMDMPDAGDFANLQVGLNQTGKTLSSYKFTFTTADGTTFIGVIE